MPGALISPPQVALGFSVPLGPSVLRLPAQHCLLATRGALIAGAGPCQLWVKAWFSSCGCCVTAGLIITPSVRLSQLIWCAPVCLLPIAGSIYTEYQLLSLPQACKTSFGTFGRGNKCPNVGQRPWGQAQQHKVQPLLAQ